jgi:hypothetical protein
MTVAPNAPRQVPETTQQEAGGRPANVCEELAAHVQQAAAKRQAPGPNPGSPNSSQRAPAPAGPGQTTPPVDRTQQNSGQSTPIPNSQGAKTPELTIEQADAMLQANDQRACQKTVQDMRRAGVALPPALLALAALRDDLLTTIKRRP